MYHGTAQNHVPQRRCGIQHPRSTAPAQQGGSEYTCDRPGWSRLDCSRRLELYSLQTGVGGGGSTWHHASHREATDQSRLVRSWEGATGKVGQRPSAVSEELQGLFLETGG